MTTTPIATQPRVIESAHLGRPHDPRPARNLCSPTASRVIGGASARQTSAGSKRRRAQMRAPQWWRAAMASLNAFCVYGSRS